MSDFYADKPPRRYEITWTSGHVETVIAHQISYPANGVAIFGGKPSGPPKIQFHAEIDGLWALQLSAYEDDIRTIRDITSGETVPGSLAGLLDTPDDPA